MNWRETLSLPVGFYLRPSAEFAVEEPTSSGLVRRRGAVEEVFTVAEVAAFLKVSKAKVYVMIDRGEFEVFRVGTHFRVRRETLDAFVGRAH